MTPPPAPERREVDLLVVGDTPAAAAAFEAGLALGARTLHVRDLEGFGFAGRVGRDFEAVQHRVDARGLRRRHPVTAGAVVLACGTEPAIPPVVGLPDVRTFTSLTLAEDGGIPESLLVLGGGPTGCEQAAHYAARGSRVTVVEAADRLLPAEEPFAADAVAEALAARGVRILVGGTVHKVSPTLDGGVYAGTEVGGDVAASHLLLATGRRGATAGLELGRIGPETDRGFVAVDSSLATSVPGLFAAGAVTGLVEGLHADPVMGRIAAANAVISRRGRSGGRRLLPGRRPRARLHWDAETAPAITTTEPRVARVGLTREAAQTRGDLAEIRAQDSGPLRIVTAREVAGRRDAPSGSRVVVGATVIGDAATEEIGLLALAVRGRMPVDQIATLALPAGTPGSRSVDLLGGTDRSPERPRPGRDLEAVSPLL